MIEAGEDPRFIARRLVILASEDIGLADPTALPTAVAAAQAVQLIGLPEARLNLAQATIALAASRVGVMAWALVASTVALCVIVLALAAVLLRLRSRLAQIEARLASSDTNWLPERDLSSQSVSLDEQPAGYLITRMGDPEPEAAPVVRMDATLFTDQLARESVVQAASLVHGLRRAMSAESRNRIRFHVRQEVRRARKQRRVEMRLAHREWTARQRAQAGAGDRAAEGSAA